MLRNGSMKTNQSSAGFTVVEVAFSVLILGILTAMAVPAFSGMRDRMAVRSTVNAVQGAISEARFTAMRTGQAASVDIAAILSELPSHAQTLPDPGLGAASDTPGVVLFEPRLAMLANPADSGSITISAGGYQAALTVSPAGHASVCTPEGAHSPGYSAC